MWRLVVEDSFSAAHALRHYRGKCEKIHGHNFSVSIAVEGNKLSDDTHILIDFKTLKNLLKLALEQVDHSLLNEIKPFDKLNPSSENLAMFIWNFVSDRLGMSPEAENVSLSYVSVSEKPGQTAYYLGPAPNQSKT